MERIGYDDLLAARVRQLDEIAFMLATLEQTMASNYGVKSEALRFIRNRVDDMKREAEAEHTEF